MEAAQSELEDESSCVEVEMPLQGQVGYISKEEAKEFLSVCGFDGKIFYIEKERILASSSNTVALFGSNYLQNDIGSPVELNEFGSDVLEPALNFLRGYSWGTLTLSSLLGVWEFSIMFTCSGLKMTAWKQILNCAETNPTPPKFREILCKAQKVDADLCKGIRKLYMKCYATMARSSFELFEGFKTEDVAIIGNDIVKLEEHSPVVCGATSRRPGDGAYIECQYRTGAINFFSSLMTWQGLDEEKTKITRELSSVINLKNVFESDIVALNTRLQGFSSDVLDKVALLHQHRKNQNSSNIDIYDGQIRCRKHR